MSRDLDPENYLDRPSRRELQVEAQYDRPDDGCHCKTWPECTCDERSEG